MVNLSLVNFVVVFVFCAVVTARICPAQAAQTTDLSQSSKSADVGSADTASSPQPVTRIAADELDEAVSSDVKEILDQWAKVSSQIKTLQGKFFLQEFNHTFETEQTYKGDFSLEAPDLGWMTTKAIAPTRGAKSARRNKDGDRYSVETGSHSHRLLFEKELLTLIDLERTDDVITLNLTDDNYFLRGSLEQILNVNKFLLGMDVDEATHRFEWSIYKSDATSVILLAVPRKQRSNRSPSDEPDEPAPMADGPAPHNFWTAFFNSITTDRSPSDTAVRLDKQTWLPTHIRLRDVHHPEMVYAFESLVVTKKADSASPCNPD